MEGGEAFAVIDGVDEEDGCGSSVEVVGDGFVDVLSALSVAVCTVSQTCSCTGCSSMTTVLEEKSTPTVTSYSSLKVPSMYLRMSEVLPVPGWGRGYRSRR